jgi:hypothetical protein
MIIEEAKTEISVEILWLDLLERLELELRRWELTGESSFAFDFSFPLSLSFLSRAGLKSLPLL